MRIFLSYARQDSALVEAVNTAVEAIGHEVWLDRELRGGQQWWDVILNEIRTCDAFLVALSRHSANSKACRRELQYAIANARPILPVMVASVDARLFPEGVANVQYVDFREATIPSTLALVSALQRLPAASPPPEVAPDPPPVPITYLDEFTTRITAESLTLKEQKAVLSDLDAHLEDEEDRPAALDLLRTLRRRPDIIESVAREIDRLVALNTQAVEVVPVSAAPVSPAADHTPPAPAYLAMNSQGQAEPAQAGARIHKFVAPRVDLPKLADRLRNWLVAERLDTQVLEMPERIVVQARSAEKWKKWVGAGVAFTISLWLEGDDLLVEIGNAEWRDKAAVAAVGFVLVPVALVPAAFGAAMQKALPAKALRVIEQAIAECTPQILA